MIPAGFPGVPHLLAMQVTPPPQLPAGSGFDPGRAVFLEVEAHI